MATLKIINNTASSVLISDVGVVIPASSFDTFDTTSPQLTREIARSSSLRTLIAAGTLKLNNGVRDIRVWESDGFLLNFFLTGTSDNEVNVPSVAAGAPWVDFTGRIWIDQFGLPWGYQAF